MYAVIETGGKQYRVSKGARLRVESLAAAEGDTVAFERVLMVGEGADVKIGRPYVDGGKVEAKVLGQGKARKVEIVKFKRRKHHRRFKGHRQAYTEIEVTGIAAG